MARPGVRQQLVDASLEVFQAQGFNGSSVQDLTDAAGVPKGSFYNHFASKEAIAVAAVALYIERANGVEVLRDTKLAPLERIRRHFRTKWKSKKDLGYTEGCLLGSLSSEIGDTHDTARAEFVRVFKGWSNGLARALQEAQDSGDISKDLDPAMLARFILNAWQGTLVRMKAEKSEEPFKDFNTMVFDHLLRG